MAAFGIQCVLGSPLPSRCVQHKRGILSSIHVSSYLNTLHFLMAPLTLLHQGKFVYWCICVLVYLSVPTSRIQQSKERSNNLGLSVSYERGITKELKAEELSKRIAKPSATKYIVLEVQGPSGPRLLAGGPSGLLTSSFAPFGRSGQ